MHKIAKNRRAPQRRCGACSVLCAVAGVATQTARRTKARISSNTAASQHRVYATVGSANQWFPGRVTAVHSDDTYDIKYDDGDEDERLSARYLSTNVDRFDDE